MVKLYAVAAVILAGCLSIPVQAQADADRERRLSELERKIRQLDPSYVPPAPAATFDQRLQELEHAVDRLLAASQPTGPVQLPSTAPLQSVSVTGDYQSSGGGETQLPVAGYMEAHF